MTLTTVGLITIFIALIIHYSTGVERMISQTTAWRIIDDGLVTEIELYIDGPEHSGCESVISDNLLVHLEKDNPDSVIVTFKATYDFGVLRGRGPILTVDEISVRD